jgi:dTDP-glucose 4,6-dehydratase
MKSDVVLVTGACGFIGSEFSRVLKDRGYENVIVVDSLTYAGDKANIAGVIPDKDFFHASICDAHAMEFAFKQWKPEYVVHFAAETHVDNSIGGPAVFAETNFMGTQVLLDVARQHGVKRFVQVSTDEVYGSLCHDDPLSLETDLLKPSSPYSASKAAAELLVLSYVRTYGMDIVVTRSSNNYGPRQHTEKFIPRMIQMAMAGENLPIYGDGTNVRDWIHVTDNCRGILGAMERGSVGEVYNLGGGNEWQNIDVATSILSVLGLPATQIEYVKDRPGHDFRYALGCEKAKRDLCWEPQWSFVDGLRHTVEWYKKVFQKHVN